MAPAKHYRDLLPLPDRIKYLARQVCGGRFPVTLRYRDGCIFRIRPRETARDMDWFVSYEILFRELYRLPPHIAPSTVKRVVDVGANIGYSAVYFARRCWNCRVEAWEPHPEHAAILRQHLQINGIEGRVEVLQAAAGTRDSTTYLTSKGIESAVVSSPAPGAVPIRILDFFKKAGTGPIDVLKMDIEGGEYAILEDRRFDNLNVRFLVMEHHRHERYPHPEQYCADRLSSLGYRVEVDPDPGASIIRAFR